MSTKPRLRWKHGSVALIGLLTLLLGFAIAVQVRAHSSGDALSGLREDDLVGILDNQNARADKLRQQIAHLQDQLDQLRNSGNEAAAARRQAAAESRALGILLGTLPADGPGVVVTITDPGANLTGEDLLDVIEELRGAGAEAIQFGPVRVTTSTSLEGSGGTVTVDGNELKPPYRVTAIGGPKTLDTALNIPGGVAGTVRAAGGTLSVQEEPVVHVTAVRNLPRPRYAQPSR